MRQFDEREEILIKNLDLMGPGVEIAPYFNPLLPKSDFPLVKILDVFDEEFLLAQAKADPLIGDDTYAKIETVDFTGSATEIDTLLNGGKDLGLKFIVSSHNFEHLPNPVKFLQGCYSVLQPGGVLSMAVPDYRACFDHFRFPTKLSEWLFAYQSNQAQPRKDQLFDYKAYFSMYQRPEGESTAYGVQQESPDAFLVRGGLGQAWDALNSANTDYEDCHCTVFNPQIARLHLEDLRALGLLEFDILEVSETRGHEFFIHLKKPEGSEKTPILNADERRHLMDEMVLSQGRLAVDAIREQYFRENRSFAARFKRRLRKLGLAR